MKTYVLGYQGTCLGKLYYYFIQLVQFCHAFTLILFKVWEFLFLLYNHRNFVMTGALIINPAFSFCSWGNRGPEQSGDLAKAMQVFISRTWNTTNCPDAHFSEFLLSGQIPVCKVKQKSQIKTFFFWKQDIRVSEFMYCFTCSIKSMTLKT